MVGIAVASSFQIFVPNAYHKSQCRAKAFRLMEALALALDIRYDRAEIRRWGAPDMPRGPSAASLTGIWHGIYSYPIPRAPVLCENL